MSDLMVLVLLFTAGVGVGAVLGWESGCARGWRCGVSDCLRSLGLAESKGGS